MLKWRAAAALWGFAEATVFFVVPDLLLSFVARERGARAGLVASVWAAAGACLGGLLMWRVGGEQPAATAALLDALPAISPGMMVDAARSLRAGPAAALVAGAFSGTPYKVFASVAQGAGVGWPAFMLASAPARLCRFSLVVALTAAADRMASGRLANRSRRALLAGFWIVFYGVFWTVMPG